MKNRFFLSSLILALSSFCMAQNADFSIPDTICEGKPVIISNVQPAGAISYRWSFCSGNASENPDGTNMGNLNQILNAPRFTILVKDSLDFYSFTTSSGNARIVRCFYGTSLSQNPLIITDLGNLGVVTGQVSGIQVKKDNGVWYGFVADGNRLVRLIFGSSPSNAPVAQVINLPNVISAAGLVITKQGADWVGFCTDIAGNSFFRLEFGTSLGADPLVVNLVNAGQLSSPVGIALGNENNAWYAFICNSGNNTISRISFGASLLNPAPTGTMLSGISRLDVNSGITLINDCGGVNGFVTNFVKESDLCIIRLVFSKGLGGPVTGYQLPNNGILNKPYGISEFSRQGDTLFAFVANNGSSSLTRMFFPSCSGASQPFYNGPDPPPITYPNPGNYNILLTVDDGNASESSKCKNIVVVSKPDLSLGPDRKICQGTTTLLDAGAGDSLYAWSTGAATQTITVDTSGTYWVHAVNFWNCEAFDTIRVSVVKNAESVVDTTICQGLSYLAQHAQQFSSGVYHDTLQMQSGCDSIVTTNLLVKECPLLIWFPNAFTPNGDDVNDEFKPVGVNITSYTLQIFNRWGALVFISNDINAGWDGRVKGRAAEPDVYTFIVTYESRNFPGETHRETGTLTLAR